MAGVHSAIWDIGGNNLSVYFDPQQTSLEEISWVISMDGYETQLHEVDKDVYKKLPDCCKHD